MVILYITPLDSFQSTKGHIDFADNYLGPGCGGFVLAQCAPRSTIVVSPCMVASRWRSLCQGSIQSSLQTHCCLCHFSKYTAAKLHMYSFQLSALHFERVKFQRWPHHCFKRLAGFKFHLWLLQLTILLLTASSLLIHSEKSS